MDCEAKVLWLGGELGIKAIAVPVTAKTVMAHSLKIG